MKRIIFFFVTIVIFNQLSSYYYFIRYTSLCYNYEYCISKKEVKYVVLSFALNFNYNRIKRFILSLNKTNFEGELILFTYFTIVALKYIILSYKVHIIILNTTYPFYPYNDSIFPISINNIKNSLYYYTGKSFVTYRYFIIKLFIKFYGFKYKFYLLTDIRDVLFQLSPFNWNIKKGIYLVEEHPKRVIGGDKSNINFVKKYRPTQKLYNSTVINGGVMYGSYPEILSFLTDFLNYICSFNCNGNDQGGLNSFIRSFTYFSYPIYILNSSHTPVKTLALWLFDSSICCLPKNNTILNSDLSIPHIIHQYDRAIKTLLDNEKYLHNYNRYLDYYTN